MQEERFAGGFTRPSLLDGQSVRRWRTLLAGMLVKDEPQPPQNENRKSDENEVREIE
jgi:hypothetical protein